MTEAPSLDLILAGAIVELLKATAEASGTCIGVAMSTDHPNPDGVLMDAFRTLQDAAKVGSAALRAAKEAGVDIEALI